MKTANALGFRRTLLARADEVIELAREVRSELIKRLSDRRKPRGWFTSVKDHAAAGGSDLPSNEIRKIASVFALAVSSRAARLLLLLARRRGLKGHSGRGPRADNSPGSSELCLRSRSAT
jgi:hypothetical protein